VSNATNDNKTAPADAGKTPAAPTNFIRNIIDAELAAGKHAQRRWSGKPGLAEQQLAGPLDPAKIRTRFPPEPNGYLHFGHAKSICLNFGLARDYGGRCHLRFDDTNPEKEEKEYVDSIVDAVHWLGFAWKDEQEDNLYYASDYFDWMIASAEYLIEAGLAYVDSQSADEMRASRGTLTEPGKDSPYRNRTPQENMLLFRRMQSGEFPDGALILRAKIDMASPNINLRDPAIYRIRHATHHNTGDKWCVYPMYTFAHPIEDALENITHSICTLEFEDQRPFYDWLLEHLAEGGLLQRPVPQQIEFSRLNLTYVILSKRKLIQLVEEKHVSGWDDPRMPTLVGARRRGYAPEGFHLFAERIGVSKADSLIDYVLFEDCMREVMNESDERRVAVLDPLKLIIDNYRKGRAKTASCITIRSNPRWARASCRSRANCGSNARTSWKCRARATAACSPATWRACATAMWSSASDATRTKPATSSPCIANTCPTPRAARRAPTASRSRAICTGFPPPMPTPPKCACTTACSPTRHRATGARATRKGWSATSSTTSIRTASRSSPRNSNRR
jgi:glutaminyl-tRNA synthetase